MALAEMIRESQDPSTAAGRLAELAQLDRDLWPAIAVHPAAYPALLEWLDQQGDPTVNAVLALRSGSPAAAPTPAGAPPPPAETPTTYAASSPVAPHSTPSSSTPGAAGSPEGGNSKNLWVVCGMVAVVLVLIGGVAFGATKVFGEDDDKGEASSSQTVDAPEPSDPPTVSSPDPADPPASGSSTDAFCEGFKQAQRAIAGSPSAAPGSAAATAKSTAVIMDSIERVAPAEVKNDVGVMRDYFETMSDPSTLDTSTIDERVKEFTEAGGRLSAYYTSNCM